MIRIQNYILIAIVILISLEGKTQTQDILQSSIDNSKWLAGKLQGETYYMSPLANNKYFLQKEWLVGSIVLTDGEIFNEVEFRYMAFGDELVAYNEKIKTIFVIDKETVKEFAFKNTINGIDRERKFINLDSLNLPDGKSYFEELFSGSARLLAYHFINKVKVKPFLDSMGIMRDTEYRPAVNYFLFTNKNELFRIKSKKASFYKIYPDHKKEIRKLFRKNRILITDQNSLIQAFRLLEDEDFLHNN